MDDPKFIDLSIKMTELSARIKNTKTLYGKMAEKVWKVKTESELIVTKEGMSLYIL